MHSYTGRLETNHLPYGGTDYLDLSQVLKKLSLPVWPMSDNLPSDVAKTHVHSNPDMEDVEVELVHTNKIHWRYVLLHAFAYEGALWTFEDSSPLARGRFPEEEMDKIRSQIRAKQSTLASDRLNNPDYFRNLLREYKVVFFLVFGPSLTLSHHTEKATGQ
jgi:hypothetical protein